MSARPSSPKPKRSKEPKAVAGPADAGSGARIPRHRMRACLCCGAPFASAGSHHRICDPCKERDDWLYGPAVTGGHTAW